MRAADFLRRANAAKQALQQASKPNERPHQTAPKSPSFLETTNDETSIRNRIVLCSVNVFFSSICSILISALIMSVLVPVIPVGTVRVVALVH